ncbi:MAG: AAA family ATPase [Candidatus Sericytochromatia bacterium]|nr:AAA family ATPase [Candidatus Sericytochromatia bacterium]
MNCMRCEKRPARFHYSQTVNGRRQELHLCEPCASEFKAQGGFTGGRPEGFPALFSELLHPLLHRHRGKVRLWDRLDAEAQHLLAEASRLAAQRGEADVRPEHLLLAMLEQPSATRWLGRGPGEPLEALRRRLLDELPVLPEAAPVEEVTLSARLKRVLQLAWQAASRASSPVLAPEHLAEALRLEGESLAATLLAAPPAEGPPRAARPSLGEALKRHTRDLTALAEGGQLDPVVGREGEIERVIRILSRRTKNNPVLLGEPGVGKTAIAEGLAQRIVAGDVPEGLKHKRVLALDLAGLVAGTRHRGDFEERVTALLADLKAQEGRVVLFIDELHTVLGAGAAEGAMDAGNLLKPALARGELRALGATTLEDYRRTIERDAALERRFQPVLVEEPTPEQALAILRGLKDLYEAHHGVRVTEEALVAAVELGDRHVKDRFLPDKAIDLLDEACAMRHLGSRLPPGRVAALEAELARLEAHKHEAIAKERFEEAQRHKDREAAVRAELDELVARWRTSQGALEPVVDLAAVARVVAEWTGIPAEQLVEAERERLLAMEAHLRQRVIGQEDAIQAVSAAVRRARTGLADARRPLGSFLFLGPTGVGKTELARALAFFLFNDEDALVRFDMSEYQERHTVSRLLGAPPGYVGHEGAGLLTEAVRRKPYRVLLFDEIEKAHPDVFNVLLQVLDDGRLTDARGRTVDFRQALVVMTSNVGAARIFELEQVEASWEAIALAARNALREVFRPEFLNRIDETVVFHPLTREQLGRVVDLMLEHTRRKLHGQHLGLVVTEAARTALAEAGHEPAYGARPLRRAIARLLETPLARLLLAEPLAPGTTITVDHGEAGFTIKPDRAPLDQPLLAGAAGGGGGPAGEGLEEPPPEQEIP